MSKKKKGEVKWSPRETKHAAIASMIISPSKCAALLKTLAKKNGGTLPSVITRKEPRMTVDLMPEPVNLHGVALKCFGIGFAYDRPVKSELAEAHESARVRAYDETLIPLLTSRGYTVVVTPGQEARFKLPKVEVKAKSKSKVKKIVKAEVVKA